MANGSYTSGCAVGTDVALVAGVFDADVALTRVDVVQRLEGKLTPQEVTEAMSELVHANRMRSRFDRAEGETVYWIVGESDASEAIQTLSLSDRLDAIASDLAAAISDACDAGLSHVLIKALAIASDATHRAARSVA